MGFCSEKWLLYLVHTWKCRNYVLTTFILCWFYIIIYISISVLDWSPNYLCHSHKYSNVLPYYQTEYLLTKWSSLFHCTVGLFCPFLVVCMFSSKYTLYHPLLEVIYWSKCCSVLVFLYRVRHIFSPLSLCAIFHLGKICSSTGTVLYCLHTVLLFCTHHCHCLTWPLLFTIHPLHYAFLSQPILQTKHKANQETFRKCAKLFQPCTAIFGMQSICVSSKHYKCHWTNACAGNTALLNQFYIATV